MGSGLFVKCAASGAFNVSVMQCRAEIFEIESDIRSARVQWGMGFCRALWEGCQMRLLGSIRVKMLPVATNPIR